MGPRKSVSRILCDFINLFRRTQILLYSIPNIKIRIPVARNRDFIWFWKLLCFWWWFWVSELPKTCPKAVPIQYRYCIGTALGQVLGSSETQNHHQKHSNFQNHIKSRFRATGILILMLGIEYNKIWVRLNRLIKSHKIRETLFLGPIF